MYRTVCMAAHMRKRMEGVCSLSVCYCCLLLLFPPAALYPLSSHGTSTTVHLKTSWERDVEKEEEEGCCCSTHDGVTHASKTRRRKKSAWQAMVFFIAQPWQTWTYLRTCMLSQYIAQNYDKTSEISFIVLFRVLCTVR